MTSIPRQDELPDELPLGQAGWSPDALHEFLTEGERPRDCLRLRVTDNRSTMISVRRDRVGGVRVNVHREFLKAPAEVIDSVRRFIWEGDRAAWRRVGAFARGILAEDRRGERVSQGIRTAGAFHDLQGIFNEVNRRYFCGRVKCAIGWGRVGRRRRKAIRWMRFGSWNAAQRSITVHPLLDQECIPREFIEYIVFHEMLHDQVPTRVIGGRRYCHTPEFRRLEKTFPGSREMRRLAGEVMRRVAAGGRP